jgi:hypothetical protein
MQTRGSQTKQIGRSRVPKPPQNPVAATSMIHLHATTTPQDIAIPIRILCAPAPPRGSL